MFREYLHVEKFGNEEVEGIELGKVYIFAKIDGTNASVWFEDRPEWGYACGSRTRELSLEKDNAGFMDWIYMKTESQNVRKFILNHHNLRLYGEWLVPHSFKGYRPEAWRQFYVFDVYNDETEQYLSYDAYKPLLDEFGITYIPPLAIVKNGDYEPFLAILTKNFFL